MIAGKRIYNENENEDGKRFDKMIDALHGESFVAVDFFPFLEYLGMKRAAEKRFEKIFVEIDAFLQELMDEQKKNVEELEGCDGVDEELISRTNNGKNLIRVLLDLKKKDPGYATDDIIKGLVQGTLLNLNLWAIQNDPNIWDEPRKFKPERFEGVKGDRVGYQFMPFGSGRRACPGENLAKRVVRFTLGSIIQCFDLERVGEIDMEENVSLSMWKAKPLQTKFHCYNDMVELLSHI
ncbi:hypothetical protein KSS87_014799 [Heliosperma pusillum]|nr:hypothetical protein KSS87_014799 [Heliosperma pusillum]